MPLDYRSCCKFSVAIVGTRGYPSYYGGFETAIRRLAPFLCDNGWNVTVYSRPGETHPQDPTRDPRVRSIVTRGISSTSLSTPSYGLTGSIHAIRSRPDVALIMNVANGFWLPLFWLSRIPTVVNVDGIEWQRQKWGKPARALFKVGAWLTAKLATLLIFDSREIREYWRSNFREDGVFIPYGGDPVTERLTTPFEPGSYVLFVARFVPENTVLEFIEAAETISRRHDVVLVGSAPHGDPVTEAVRSVVAANPRIHWLGQISDDHRLFALWRNCGAYFHGHSVGGTNPALVQAMHAGAKVVARDTPYNREVLGDSGAFCEPTPAAIALAVMDVIAQNGSLGEAAAKRASELYSWESVTEAYLEALRTAIEPALAGR